MLRGRDEEVWRLSKLMVLFVQDEKSEDQLFQETECTRERVIKNSGAHHFLCAGPAVQKRVRCEAN